MAQNVLLLHSEVSINQNGTSLIDPGSGKSLIIDWITVDAASAVSAELFVATASGGQADSNTIFHSASSGWKHQDFRSPKNGGGLRFKAGEHLRVTNGAVALKVLVGYHIVDD